MTYRHDLHNLIEPAVNAAGFELLGIEFVSQGKHSLLRIYIDHEDGISIENCETASKQISAMLDVEDPIKSEYSLEVSSPGIERPLFLREHFIAATGKEVKIKMLIPIEGKRNFKGMIEGVEEDQIILQFENEHIKLPIAEVAKAYLVVKL